MYHGTGCRAMTIMNSPVPDNVSTICDLLTSLCPPPHPSFPPFLPFLSLWHLVLSFPQSPVWFWMCWFSILLSVPSQSASLFIFQSQPLWSGGWDSEWGAECRSRSLPWSYSCNSFSVLITLSAAHTSRRCSLQKADDCTRRHASSD